MALKNQQPAQLHDAIGYHKSLSSSDGTTITDIETVASGQDNEQSIYSIMLQSTDAGSNVVSFYIHNGTAYFFIGSRTVPATGDLEVIANTSTPLKRMFKDLRGNYFLKIKPGEKLAFKVGTALTGGETMLADVDGWSYKAST